MSNKTTAYYSNWHNPNGCSEQPEHIEAICHIPGGYGEQPEHTLKQSVRILVVAVSNQSTRWNNLSESLQLQWATRARIETMCQNPCGCSEQPEHALKQSVRILVVAVSNESTHWNNLSESLWLQWATRAHIEAICQNPCGYGEQPEHALKQSTQHNQATFIHAII